MHLPSGEQEVNGIAQTIHYSVNFRGLSPGASPDKLVVFRI